MEVGNKPEEPANEIPLGSEKLKKQSKKKLIFKLGILLAVLAMVFGGFLYLIGEKDELISAKDQEITSLIQQVAQSNADSPTLEETEPIPQATETGVDLPVIIFTPGGLFDEAEKQEITTKLIDPYIDYQSEVATETLVAIHVQHNVVNSQDTDYVIDALYTGGVYEGFLYGNNTQAEQPWYKPECLDACTFSDEYKAKYPEVVAE